MGQLCSEKRCLALHHTSKQEPFLARGAIPVFLMYFPKGVAGLPTPPERHQPVLHASRLEKSHNSSTVSRPSTETPALPGWDEHLEWDHSYNPPSSAARAHPVLSAPREMCQCPLTITTDGVIHSGLQWQNMIRKFSPLSGG